MVIIYRHTVRLPPTPIEPLSERHTLRRARARATPSPAIVQDPGCSVLARPAGVCSAPPFPPALGKAKMTHSDYQGAAQTELRHGQWEIACNLQTTPTERPSRLTKRLLHVSTRSRPTTGA